MIREAMEDVSKKHEVQDVKDKFLATMSHELRTPLNGIVGMITMLQDAGPLNAKQQEYLGILMECSHQLMNLMNNILDFSKMSSNRLVLLRNALTIEKAIRDAYMMIDGKIKAKNVELIMDIQSNIPTLVGDSQRLTQVIANLLTNAVKFTDRGHIKLSVRTELQEPINYVRTWRVDFVVEDTGIGIPIEDQQKVFESYHQSSNQSQVIARNGTGLGLSISKELIRLMGGSIRVKSEGVKGKGSTFSFYIIAQEEINIINLREKHQEVLKGAKILVVDDRAEYRIQLYEYLLKWECQPTILSSGEEALKHLEHAAKFDVAIVDICMPYMSGIELAQELRALRPTLPLIALSSIDLESNKGLFDHYMNKPIDQNLVFSALLDSLIKSKKEEGDGSSIKCNQTRTKKLKQRTKKQLRILIAEDDPTNSYTLKEMLTHIGFSPEHIKIVTDGEKCVKYVKKHNCDVVLMDIVMPIMNGLEATKHIRQLRRRPYIIAVSAAVQNSDKQQCQEVGIDGYLPKPIIKERLIGILTPLLKSE
jgi:CheY-like chemotaxis protein